MYTPLTSPTYKKAPIIEAVIELRLGAPVSHDIVEKIGRRLEKRYDKAEDADVYDLYIEENSGAFSVKKPTKQRARRLFAFDQSKVAIINQRALITSSLPPYPGWDIFRGAARENWSDLRAVVSSPQLERLGVRFINRIDIPNPDGGAIKVGDYFTVYPAMDALEVPLVSFLIQATIATHQPDWIANITIIPALPPPVPNYSSIVLDIDVFRTSNIPAKDDELWSTIDIAQAVKNDLFERSLTKKAKELFA